MTKPITQCTTTLRQHPYFDWEICFHLELYKGYYEISDWCLGHLRKWYPRARLITTSDGDPDERYRLFVVRYGVELHYGDHLWAAGASGALWKRRFDYYLEDPRPFFIRIDSDVGFYRPFRLLPATDCLFGTFNLENNVGPFGFIQGGFIGLTHGAVLDIKESGLLERMGEWNHEWKGRLMASDDKAISDAAQTLAIPLFDHPEVASQWKDKTPNADLKYAVVHPCKDMIL